MTFNFLVYFAIALLGFASMAHAHMRLSSPVPFAADDSDNGPLAREGSGGPSFPCKQSVFNYKVTAMNEIPVNEPVLLDFKGSAVHGGGSCQLSISLDEEPTPESVFKVIQTFEGGCPVPGGSGGFTFNIPKNFPNSERATLAWTWISKLSGGQEFYMDCAPIKITGGADNKDYFNGLPDMFKANIPQTDCMSVLSTDVQIPNPGKFFLQTEGTTLKAPTGSQCGAGAPSSNNKNADTETNLAAYTPPAKDSNKITYVGGASSSGGGSSGAAPSAPATGGDSGAYNPGSGNAGSGNAGPGNAGSGAGQSYDDGQYRPSAPASQRASSPVASPSAPASQPASSPAASAPAAPISYAPPANQATSSALQTTLQTKTSSAAGNPYPYPTLSPTSGAGISQPSGPAAPSSGMPSSSANSTSGTGSGTCSQDGAVVCNGSDQFGLCNHGKIVWQTVAAGTKCNDGVIEKRDAAKLKRHAHVGRHAHGMRL